MGSEKQRLDIIEVLCGSYVCSSSDILFMVFLFSSKKYTLTHSHTEYASPDKWCAHSLGGQAETSECNAHERFASDRRSNAEKSA